MFELESLAFESETEESELVDLDSDDDVDDVDFSTGYHFIEPRALE